MNTTGINVSNSNVVNNSTAASLNSKASQADKSPTSLQEKAAARARMMSMSAPPIDQQKANEMEAAAKAKEESNEVDDYLKTVSRFENKVKEGDVETDELKKIIDALNDRILSLNETQKDRLLRLEFFKQNKIDNLNALEDKLTELFESEVERDSFFTFLKDPEFMRILLKEPEQVSGYSPQSIAKSTASEAKGDSSNALKS